MKKVGLLLSISFLFYLFGHLLWTISTVNNGDADLEFWFISLPFAFFAIFGLLASLRLYKSL